MNHRPVAIMEKDEPITRWEWAIHFMLVATLAFLPLAFGAVEAWSELAFVSISGLMLLTLSLRAIFRHGTLAWSGTFLPALLFAGLAAAQLLPLGKGIVSVISPATAETKADLLSNLSNVQSAMSGMTASFYPNATRHDLRLVLALFAIFVVTVTLYRRVTLIKHLLGAVAAIGGGIALLSMAQTISNAQSIYWSVPVGHVANAGTFVNHSNFAQYMNLSVGATLALLFVKLHEAFQDGRLSLAAVMERLGQPKMRIIWLLGGLAVLGLASIFLSLSRGGMIACLIALCFTALVVAGKRAMKGRGWIMAVMALAAFICVLYIGFEAVYDRLSTLRDTNLQSGRWQIVKDIGSAWTRFPIVGTGLGTHRVVYPMFDRSTIPELAAHAENEYAQAAEETGALGLLLLAAFAVMVWVAYARSIRPTQPAICSAAFGLGFGLLAVMIQSLSDFGQHLPANAALSVVSCGLLIVLAQLGPKPALAPSPSRDFRARPAGILMAVATVLVWGWCISDAGQACRAESCWNRVLEAENRFSQNDWRGANADYANLIADAAAAAALQPDNIEYRHNLNVYRWHSISRVRDPQTGGLVVVPQTVMFTRRIVNELHEATAICPTYGPSYCLAGQLERTILGQACGSQDIQTGYRLAPCDPTVCYAAGELAALEGRMDEATVKIGRAVELNGQLFKEAVGLFVNQLKQPATILKIAGDNMDRLFTVAGVLQESWEYKDLAGQVRGEAVTRLKARCQESDATAGQLADLAGICAKEKDYQAAADYYERALTLEYGQVEWRLDFARSLVQLGKYERAMHEARICLRLRPQMVAAQKLVSDLSLQVSDPGSF